MSSLNSLKTVDSPSVFQFIVIMVQTASFVGACDLSYQNRNSSTIIPLDQNFGPSTVVQYLYGIPILNILLLPLVLSASHSLTSNILLSCRNIVLCSSSINLTHIKPGQFLCCSYSSSKGVSCSHC
jgi:hypothetical protein